MPNPKPPYRPEFRAEAVRLARQPGNTVRQVARDLGIANESLRRWIKEQAIESGDAAGLTAAEREELRTLRRRVRTLEEERAILVKASAFFARETDRTR